MTTELTTELFIKQAQDARGNKYDYSLVEYKNNCTPVKIICRLHGVFEQTPSDHLRLKGCIHCSRAYFINNCIKNNNGLGILYIIGCFNDDKTEVFIKIGITSRSIKKRFKDKTKMPYNYKIIHEITGSPEFIYDLETKLHKKSKHYLYTPTIPFNGSSTECFKGDTTYLKKLNTYVSELIPF